MDEELLSRIQKIERELQNAKFLIIFLIVMFIMLGYQFLSVRQRDVRYLNTLRTKGIILEDRQGNDAMYMGFPAPVGDTNKNITGGNGIFMMGLDGTSRLVIGQIKNDSVVGLQGDSWGYRIMDEVGKIRGEFLIFDPADTVIHSMND